MATRATYTVKNNLTTTHLYIHWDGYLQGAAVYFYNALTEAKGGFAERMIRANEGAELTSHFSHHGDTEFHYEIREDMTLTASRWQSTAGLTRKLAAEYVGCIYEFVNQHVKGLDGFHEFRRVESKYGRARWFNSVTAKAELEGMGGALYHLRAWQANNINKGSANWDYCVADLKSITAVFPEIITPEISEFLAS